MKNGQQIRNQFSTVTWINCNTNVWLTSAFSNSVSAGFSVDGAVHWGLH